MTYVAYKGDQFLSKSNEDTKHVCLQFWSRQGFAVLNFSLKFSGSITDNPCLRRRPVRSYNGKLGNQGGCWFDECPSSLDMLRYPSDKPQLLLGPLPVFARLTLGVSQLTAFCFEDWAGHPTMEQLAHNDHSRTSWTRSLCVKQPIHQGS